MSRSVLVVIPTFNCESQIIRVLEKLERIPKIVGTDFWVIDNGSTDFTYQRAFNHVIENKITNISVYQTFQNNSLGGTIKIAFNSAKTNGYDYVAIFHGDDQGDVSDLHKILGYANSSSTAQSILGSRFMWKSKLIGYSKIRIAGNLILNFIYSIFTRRLLTDLGSGLNLYRVKDISRIDYMKFADSLTFNYELILAMIRMRNRFIYFPIIWKEEDQVSNAKNFSLFYSAIKILTNFLLRKSNEFDNSFKTYRLK
jgi:dolichol-phosphate mannosyltransferase